MSCLSPGRWATSRKGLSSNRHKRSGKRRLWLIFLQASHRLSDPLDRGKNLKRIIMFAGPRWSVHIGSCHCLLVLASSCIDSQPGRTILAVSVGTVGQVCCWERGKKSFLPPKSPHSYSEELIVRQRSTQILSQVDKRHSPKSDDSKVAPAEIEDLAEADYDDTDESSLVLHSEEWPKEGRNSVTDTSRRTEERLEYRQYDTSWPNVLMQVAGTCHSRHSRGRLHRLLEKTSCRRFN